jgi:hypothetical protein
MLNEQKKRNNEIIFDQNENGSENLQYEYTPIYASGSVYLPSLIDKITGQMCHKEFLYTIMKLLLTGERPSQKSSDKKLGQLFNNLSSSNLFLIPCESRNESFSDMFKRLLIKYKMISIALYRKNVTDNFYYVYTNPRKTTLIRDTDLVFVLSSTENIVNFFEKNMFRQSLREDNDDKFEDKYQSFKFKRHFSQRKETTTKKISFNQKEDKKKRDSIFNKIDNKLLIFDKKNKKLFNSLKISDDKDKDNKDTNFNNKGKYAEIDNLQNRLDKSIGKLKNIKKKSIDINGEIKNFVRDGIFDEFYVYLNKKYDYNT